MIKNIKGYSFNTKKSHDSPNGTWYEAVKDGKKFFLKKFKEPKYPHVEGTDPDGSKKAECNEWYSMRTRVLDALRQLGNGTGNCRFPTEIFREKATYYQVSHWVDIKRTSVKGISRLPNEEKLFILRTYSAALSRVHRVNLIHGDIKPDNVLIDKSESDKYVAKLIDFDDSYFSKEPLSPSLTKSTEDYKSPELAAYVVTDPKKNPKDYKELKNRLTCAVDVFASGLMFHEFWSGSMPKYKGLGTDKAFYKAVLSREEYEYDKRIPDWLMALIDDMLQREPEKRPSMNEVFEAIKAQSYTKQNEWQSMGIGPVPNPERTKTPVPVQPKVDFSRLRNLLVSVPDDLESLKPDTVVKKINMICGYIKQNLTEMDQNQVNVLTVRLANEIKSLKKTKRNPVPVPPGEMKIVNSLPNGIRSVEIISSNLVKVVMSDGRKIFKTKAQAYKMGIVKI